MNKGAKEWIKVLYKLINKLHRLLSKYLSYLVNYLSYLINTNTNTTSTTRDIYIIILKDIINSINNSNT